MVKKISVLPLLTMLIPGVRAVGQTLNISMELGPYSKNQNDPLVPYTIKSTYTSSKTIYEIFRFGDDVNPNMQTVTKANHVIESNTTYTGYVSVPTKSLFGSTGMKITFEVFNENGSRIKTGSCFIYPKTSLTINPTSYSYHTYQCPETHAMIVNNKTFYTTESYTFTQVDDYFLTDLYYRLPIEQFVINTTLSDSEFTYSKAYLKIVGMDEYFPSLTYTNGVATINLNVDYNDGQLTFSPKTTLFVDRNLLLMSIGPKVSYVQTKNFYLPINHQKDLVGSSFTFGIEEIGYNKSSFIWQSALLAESPLIGNCHNSGYCVVGTVTK